MWCRVSSRLQAAQEGLYLVHQTAGCGHQAQTPNTPQYLFLKLLLLFSDFPCFHLRSMVVSSRFQGHLSLKAFSWFSQFASDLKSRWTDSLELHVKQESTGSKSGQKALSLKQGIVFTFQEVSSTPLLFLLGPEPYFEMVSVRVYVCTRLVVCVYARLWCSSHLASRMSGS